MASKHISVSIPAKITSGGPTTTVDPFVDAFSLQVLVADTNAAPTDNVTYAMTLAQSDTNAGQTETVELGFPAGVYTDSNVPPSDVNGFNILVWLSGSSGSGVASPANANGQNDGSFATISTAVAGSATEEMLSILGANIGAVSFSSCIYRGWFDISTPLVTSRGVLTAYSQTGLFSPITMLDFSALGGSLNHLAGTFTFDLLAAGVDTPAKLASLRMSHATQDAVAGVTPAVMRVDAGAIELLGVF